MTAADSSTASPGPPPKLLYLAERNPVFDREGFTNRWREHGRVGMSLPRWRNIQRYMQCDPLAVPVSPFMPCRCDGIAMVWYASEAARQAHVADQTARDIMRRDEAETFARPVCEFSYFARETVVTRLPDATARLFIVAGTTGPVSDRVDAGALHRDRADRIVTALSTVRSPFEYVQNTPAPPVVSAGGLGLSCTFIDEIAVADPEVLSNTHLMQAIGKSYAVKDACLYSAAWTRDVILHDRGPPA